MNGSSAEWVRVRAPVRVFDAGGWTDTWFAEQGVVCHLCVSPGAEAYVRAQPCRAPEQAQVHLKVPDYADDYSFSTTAPPHRHPLLEATLRRWAPPRCDLDVEVSCAVPAGSSLGTSASVVVALMTALRALSGEIVEPAMVARAAHDIETIDLGRQSGVQDQVAAAFGGVNLVRIAPYPHFEVSQLSVSDEVVGSLADRLVTVYLGAHDSSDVHLEVIAHLTRGEGPGRKALEALRAAATSAGDALVCGDLAAYGQAMTAATEAQALLGPTLVNPTARELIEVAAKHGAIGWKVNGAGGPGGSLSILCEDDPGALLTALAAVAEAPVLPVRPCASGACLIDTSR
ncbi:MAG TPA: hypothetical protein VME20_12790 [Acidimicrobiales bacterium]|nr:hypothetical protein [Acidimicrobiales bacterium]